MRQDALAADVATACRILAAQGHEHSFLGHVSARQEGAEAMQVKPSGIGLAEVNSDDVLTVGLDGRLIAGTRPMHAEMPIHTSIYRNRGDVNAIIHTHPLQVAALAASSGAALMVNQDSIHFADDVAFYPSARLIATSQQGDALARALGDKRAAVLKNHGLVIVGRTIREAVFLAVAFVNSLRVQALATRFGEVECIAPDEVEAMAVDMRANYDRMVDSWWQYFVRCAR